MKGTCCAVILLLAAGCTEDLGDDTAGAEENHQGEVAGAEPADQPDSEEREPADDQDDGTELDPQDVIQSSQVGASGMAAELSIVRISWTVGDDPNAETCEELYSTIDEHHEALGTAEDAELRVIGDDMHEAAVRTLDACTDSSPDVAEQMYERFEGHYQAHRIRAEAIRGPR